MRWQRFLGIGENIHLVPNESDDHLTTGEELVALWAAEAEFFDFDKPKWSISRRSVLRCKNLECKNFTQMIWRASIELGVSRFWNTTKNCLAIVAFYRPNGTVAKKMSLPEIFIFYVYLLKFLDNNLVTEWFK